VADIKWRFWQDITKRLVDRLDGTWAERVEAYPPKVLMTDSDGDYARMRVDVGQTGFFAGREFKTFYEFNIPSGQTQVIRIISPVNRIVQRLDFEIELSELRVELRTGGTESGTWATNLPILYVNSMTTGSGYSPQVSMQTGGVHTGGDIYDLFSLYSGSNQNKAISVSLSDASPEGYSAGTYYISMQNTDGANAVGIFRTRWEERP
tara:strand:- start:1884 stop:2504 length:621 start_codon:yes stop_codon:yes gene_type:complete